MSLKDIARRTRELIQENGSLTNQGNCRNATAVLGSQLKEEFPKAQINFLAHPKAQKGNGVHYALSARQDSEELIINPVSAPGFPQTITKKGDAHPMFGAMKKVKSVK